MAELLAALKSGDVGDLSEEDINNPVSAGGKTSLHIACEYGHTSLVRTLCSMGADACQTDWNGRTPAHEACKQMHTDTMLAMIEFVGSQNYRIGLLHYACIIGNVDAVDVLLENVPIIARMLNILLHSACNTGNLKMISLLCNHGADVNARGFGGNTPLLLSVKQNNYEVASVLIKEFKCNTNTKGGDGRSALHVACSNGDPRMVSLLCDHGANVNAEDKRGNTPLLLLVKKNVLALNNEGITYGDLIRLLCDHGADIDARDSDGNTPLIISVKNEITMTLVKGVNCNPNIKGHDGMSPLHIACSNDDFKMVYLLCENGADVNARDLRGNTPLLLLVQKRNYEILIRQIKCDPNTQGMNGSSPLHIACKNGDPRMVSVLCDHGANVNAKDLRGKTPLLWLVKRIVTKHNPNSEGIANGDLILIRSLCDNGADLDARDDDGNTPLCMAVANGRHEVVRALLEKCVNPSCWLTVACINGDLKMVRLLCDHGSNMNARDSDGNTPLIISVKNRYFEIAMTLVKEFNCNPNIKGRDGMSPLHIACSNNDLRMVYLLCECGTDMNARDFSGNTPLLLLVQKQNYEIASILITEFKCDPTIKNRDDMSPLHIVSRNGDLRMVYLLCEHGADVNARDFNDHTPLLLSVQKQNYEIALVLIKQFKCDPNTEDIDGNSPLHIACRNGDLRMVRLLCDHGADVNAIGKAGNTPLLFSVLSQNCYIASALINDFKCNSIDIKNNDGMSPLHIACSNGDLRMVRLLCDHDADINVNNHAGYTPLALSVKKQKYEIVLMLIEEFKCYLSLDSINWSPLHVACSNGDLRMVRLLCDHGADVNAKDHKGDIPLAIAVRVDQKVALTLLSKYNCNSNIKNNKDETLLHIACSKGDYQNVYLLCDHGADVNAVDGDGNTPLATAAIKKQPGIALTLLKKYNCHFDTKNNEGKSPLHIACINGDLKTVTLLCDHGADVNAGDGDGNTPLAIAVRLGWLGNQIIVLALLDKYNCNPNIANISIESPLHIACSYGDFRTVKLLCDHGADVNAKDGDGNTPLAIAVYSRNGNALQTLIKYDCNFNIKNGDGQSPLHIACINCDLKSVTLLCDHGADVNTKDGDGNTPLAVAVRIGWQGNEIVLALLDKYNCNPNITNNSIESPLHIACASGVIEIVSVLINDHGADLNSRDQSQNTPLMVAVSNNHCSIVKLLISNYNCDIGVQGSGGRTLLHIAAAEGHMDMLYLLLNKYGMSVSLVDEAGNTPLHVAAEEAKQDIALTLLYDYNAPVYLRNRAGAIPSDLAPDYNLKEEFSSYLTRHHVELEANYRAMEKLATSRYSGKHCIIRLFVLGHPGAGKSSLVETLKRERFFQSLTRVSDKSVPLHTAGIVPSVHTSTTYGRVQFYDFAGDPEYYSSHAAILKRLFQSDIGSNVCIIVLDLTETETEIKKKLNFWCSFISHNSQVLLQLPSIIIIGSHADQLSKKEILKKSSNFCIPICLDCCNPRPKNISQLRQKLHDTSKSSPAFTLSYEESLLLGLLEKDFSNVTACTAKTIFSHIQEVDLKRLPRSVSGLYTLFKRLQAIGVLLIVGDVAEDCYLVLNVAQLTNEVHRKLFANDAGSILVSYNIGLLPLSILKGILPEYITKECLIQLQYCQEISHKEITDVDSSALSTLTDESFLFFPALNKLDKSEVSWLIPPEGSFSLGWLARCTHPHDHFPPRFLHVLLLRIAVRFTLVASLDVTQETDTTYQSLKRRCQMWKTGVHWLTRKGVECEVDMDISQYVVVSVCCKENSKECLTLFNSIISCVMEAKAEFCHSIQLKFYLLDKLASLANDNLYELKEVEAALQKNDKMIVSVKGETWMCCSKLVYIRSTFWDALFSIDEQSVLNYIKVLVQEWFQLGQCLQLPVTTLKTIEKNYPTDVHRQKVEMVVTWLSSTHSHPPCWWTLVKALQEIGENRSVEDIKEEHGEHINMQKKLIEPAYSEIKPDDEFCSHFSGVVGGKWPYLASLLSLNSSVIQEIRAEGEGQSQKDQAYLMLQKWSSRDGATYSQLQPIALFTLFTLDP